MSLRFVFGGSGSGKSTYVFEEMLKKAKENPEKQFFVMVPDQFTMSTQKKLCQMSRTGGIMNIDVQSFSRMVYRISEEVGEKNKTLLDDTGKNLILRNIALQKEDELVILGQKLRRPGYIHEVKSMISEFYQYAISPTDLEEMIEQAKGKGNLPYKLADLKVLYEGFQTFIKDQFMTSEESMLSLCRMISKSKLLKDCEIVFDGFTGFTPLQCQVLYEILRVAERVTITLCADGREDVLYAGKEQSLFALSQQTYSKLCQFADKEQINVEENLFLTKKPVYRLAANAELAFLEAQLFRYQGKTYQNPTENIGIHEAQNLVSEVQQVCHQIKKQIRENGYCYRDIAVVTGDLNRYAHIVQREFERYDIPYFLDQNRGVLYHPMTEYLKKALEIIKRNFSYESVMGFLKSGMTQMTLEEVDLLSLYLKKYGIRFKKAFQNPFVKGKQDPLLERAEQIRQKLMEEIAPLLEKPRTASDYVTALYEICVRASLQMKCNEMARQFEEKEDYSRAKEYEKIYAECMNLFDQIYQLLGEEKVSVDEFLEIFEAGLSEIQIGTIPQNVDQVVVGDMERSRLGEIKSLFFLGVNDGVIPGKGSTGGFLSMMEREFFLQLGREMAPSARQQIFVQRLYLYQNMTKPTEKLQLSYVKMTGDGKQALPSYLVRVVKGLYPKIRLTAENTDSQESMFEQVETLQDGLDDLAELMRIYVNREVAAGSAQEKRLISDLRVGLCAYKQHLLLQQLCAAATLLYYPQKLSAETARLLYQEKDKGSISRLETFAACQYAQFLKYGLGLKTPEEYAFTTMDLGNIYHEVLHALFGEAAKEKKTILDLSKDEVEEKIDSCMESLVHTYGNDILLDNERNKFRVTQMKKVLRQSVDTLQYQLQKGTFEPKFFEKNFVINGQQDLIGKVDRVDLLQVEDKMYVKIIDYKSSSKTFDEANLFYGLSLQLPLYLFAMTQKVKEQKRNSEVIPAAMHYFCLDNPIIKEEDLKKEENPMVALYKNMRVEGVTLESDEVLQNLDQDFATESDVLKVKRKKDGYLTAASQTVTREQMELYLAYAKEKAEKLTESIKDGNIAINPVVVEGATKDSCTFCAYRPVCRLDYQIPGFETKELSKLSEEERKEAMQHAIDKGSKAGSDNKK